MPYDKSNPPAKIKGLPAHAKDVWISAYNSASKQYEDEATINATAWAAVKTAGYSQDKEGKWHKVGKIIAKDETQRYTLGVVYEPGVLDTDNEFTDAPELEKACWDFMRSLQAVGKLSRAGLDILSKVVEANGNGDEIEIDVSDAVAEIEKRGVNGMHVEDLEGCEVVECYIAPADMVVNGEAVKRGTWMAGVVWDKDAFEKIKTGEWTGYSMGGLAQKITEAES